MKHIAQEQKYIFLIAPVRKGRNNRHSAGCDEGNAFPLLIQLIYLYLEKIAGGAAGAAVQGIGGIGGVFLKTGVSVATSATSTVATNAIQYAGDWDGFAASMSSFDTWSGVITSGAGALVTNCLGEMNLGTKVEKLTGKDGKTILNTIHTKVDGFNSSQIGSIQSFNSLVGGLATSALSYGLTGEATFNVLNISNFGAGASCGLLEVSVGNNGVKTRLGTGGTDVSVGTLLSAISGIKNLGMNEKIKKAAQENNMAQSATALRMLYGFGDDKGLELLDDVLNKKVSLAAGSGPENAQTILENGKRTVYLNGYSNDMTREEQLKLGITLGHEAYRDGVKGDELTQKIETRNAVAGHTDMMTRMLGDSMYAGTLSGIIEGDRNLQLDLIARSLGDDVFNDYVDNCYDSSADYWRVLNNGDLLDDGLDDRVSFEDGRETIYYGKRSKQGTLEKFLGIQEGEGYKLLYDAGYSFDKPNSRWNIKGYSTIGTVISREMIEKQISAGAITNTQYYVPQNPIQSGINSVKNTISSIFGDEKERQILKEKQKEKIEDPKYQQGSKGPCNYKDATNETTWCNMSTLGITFDTCYDLSMALRNENDIYGENTNANAMYDNLAKAAAKEGSRIVEITTPEMAQKLANKGYTVVGSWKNPNPEKSGHIATVESGHKYSAADGPYFGNVGAKISTGVSKPAIKAFIPSEMQNIKYYYCPTQFLRRRAL